ncbi:hypothetical protein AXK11_01205 [Cephaloticoccus primus]|uniref:Uncharacterized protein n=1 Tax=Cephaloticoccus primus TaxID=1548207 RepID=A0A139SU31_9BACT|nr:DUF6580 family putative transport protein [Cephaloticoccus primus]KXU38086.1 hypothetical protein AXK11_01205 [Cephaloticoccus primus]
MLHAVMIIVLAAAWRVVPLWHPELANFSPLMALAFCGGVYFRNRWLWLVPLAALGLSDLYVNYHYATEYDFFEMPWSSVALRMLCFVAAIGIGCLIARRKSWGTLFGGAFAASLLFYLVTNTAAWAEDGFYAKTLAGWWQALTVGHPEYPSTLSFFRNSLLSDLSFTALFAVALEYAALRTGQHTLLTPPAPAEPVAG